MERPQSYKGKLVFLALIALALLIGANSVTAVELFKSQEVKTTGKLTVANTLEYAPFEFIGEDGKPTGVNIELAAEAARLLGVELDLVRMPFTSMIPGLAAERFKISWETFSPTEERLKQVDFVIFLKAGTVASTTKEKAALFGTENNLCGKRLGMVAGNVADFTADKLNEICKESGLPEITKAVFPEAKDIVQAVLAGRVDARFDDATSSGYYEVISGGKLVVVKGLYDVSPLGIAVPKGDTETAEMMRAVLQSMIENGAYQKIMAKYGLTNAMIDEAYIVDSMDKVRQ
jgi:polar amino acid transport system substrate-binding protein